jgi:cytochrome c oxidase assembly factor CtaG
MFAHGIAPSDPSSWYLQWPFEPLVWATVAVTAWLYVRAARRVPGWPRVRTLHFLVGLGVLFVALASPVASYESALFSIHMVQHLLLTLMVAPLLVLGAPITLAFRVASPARRRQMSDLMGRKVVDVLTHPVVAWPMFAGVVVLTHFSGLYNAALENDALHLLEHVLYLGSALLFWSPVVALHPSRHRLPHPARIVYLLLTMPVQAFVALAIYSAGTVLYAHYETLQRPWGPAPLDDQQAAAVVMWVGGDGLVLLAFVLTMLAWMRHDDRLAARFDRRSNRASIANPERDV